MKRRGFLGSLAGLLGMGAAAGNISQTQVPELPPPPLPSQPVMSLDQAAVKAGWVRQEVVWSTRNGAMDAGPFYCYTKIN